MTTARSRPPAPAVVPVALAAALDAVLLIVFATLGRGSHEQALSVSGVAGTAWPFLIGAALGWAASYALLRRAPTDVAGGLLVWVATIVGGMALRAMTGQGVAASFVVVASVVTAVLLFGWRAIAARVARGRGRSASARVT